MFDIPTLSYVTGILQILLVVVLFVSWMLNRDVAGIRSWFFSFLFISVGILLQFPRNSLSPFFTILVSHVFINTGSYLSLVAIMFFLRRRDIRHWFFASAMLCYSLLIAYFVYIKPDFTARVIIMSFTVGTIWLNIFLYVIVHSDRSHIAERFYAYIALLTALFHYFRSAHNILVGSESTIASGSNWVTQLTFLQALYCLIFLAIAVVLLIAEEKSHRLKRLSEFDGLTDIFNRRAFMALFEKAYLSTERSGKPLSFLIMDLDKFKSVNDSHGHLIGDSVLKHFVATASATLRPGDIIGRFGGEEFVVFLPDTMETDAAAVAERIRSACEASPLIAIALQITITVSIGVVELKGESPDEAISRADEALYKAKNSGRNRIVVAEAE